MIKLNEQQFDIMFKSINDYNNNYSNIIIPQWGSICKNYILTEEFIEKYDKYLSWPFISEYQKLSEDFIRKMKDKVYWYCIFKYQDLSIDFIEEMQEYKNNVANGYLNGHKR